VLEKDLAAKQRLESLGRFYSLLDSLAEIGAGPILLSQCTGRMTWPIRGVYFFREHGENRTDSGTGPRIVRVGTHALGAGSRTSLWNRLSQHRGLAKSGGGNHRGSIFRLLVGTALINAHGYDAATWGIGNSAPKDVREREQELEKRVTEVIGAMSIMWLDVGDPPGPDSQRGYIERNAIALLSNFGKPPLDAPSSNWLGQYCNREKVRSSGLWNQNHVDEDYDARFLGTMENLIARAGRRT